ncbi:acyltransferase family protein [uncultured Parabacteroides sp.]|uniref:acyltransferase family protein n=1 Tax=uncultured Parabacteroides sp. TaxID=512312 RepID=UPI0034426FA1
MSNRIAWIDWSKVLLIYLVVLAHYGNIGNYADSLICHFHMPAFFLISGYLHKPLNIKDSLLKNTKRLLVPAFLFSLVCWGFYTAIEIIVKHQPLTLEDNVLRPLLGIVCYDRNIAFPQCGVIWFLEILFICQILLDSFLKIGHRSVFIFCLLSVVATCVWTFEGINDFGLLFYVQRLCASFPFVALGYYAKKQDWMLRISNISPFVAILFLLMYIAGVYFNGRTGIYSYQFGYSVLVYLQITLCGCLCFFYYVNKVKIGGKILVTLSNSTILILCLHRLMITVLYEIGVGPYLGSLIIIILCYPLSIFFTTKLPWFIGRF